MKKYLMTGVVALAICAAFTSCSKSEELYNQEVINQNEVADVYEQYNRAFIATFGEVNPNQDWGFGKNFGKIGTRATGEFANHVGAYPDANMWTSKGFLAPDPLTPSQKLRAQYYFQMNNITSPNRPDYGTKDFFMQQVYDGGTDPMVGKSPEVYKSAQNTNIESGEHMDHLTCGPGHLHTFNFNNGNCSTNGNVSDRDQEDVNQTSKQHSDQIQLMLNTPTSCFGYANSDASYVRDDRWTLVGADVIDNFCDSDPGFATWLASRLPAGEQDVKCDDDFHRGFIGFDFDMIPDNSTYAGTPVDKDGNPVYDLYNHADDVDHINYEWYKPEIYGEKYHYLSANGNMYCGQSQTIDPAPTGDSALALLNEGWLPTTGSADKIWTKVGGCNDGYFSDWIVTYMPAESQTPPSDYDVRIMAEDLNATAGDGDIEDSDWDFNDVVFDVKYNEAGTGATIKLIAAGGVLPLFVAGHEVHAEFGFTTPDDKGQYPMINTGKGPQKDPVTFDIQSGLTRSLNGKDITIVVRKKLKDGTEKDFTLDATQGKPAAKFATYPSVDYSKERVGIDFTSHYAFSRGVAEGGFIWW